MQGAKPRLSPSSIVMMLCIVSMPGNLLFAGHRRLHFVPGLSRGQTANQEMPGAAIAHQPLRWDCARTSDFTKSRVACS
jgi:hypothetical protein